MKGKPIEPGCLAMVVGSKVDPENNGRTVRVVRRCANGAMPPELIAQKVILRDNPAYHAALENWWVEPLPGKPPLSYSSVRLGSTQRVRQWLVSGRSYREKYLVRIDGDASDVIWEKKEKEVPTKEDVY